MCWGQLMVGLRILPIKPNRNESNRYRMDGEDVGKIAGRIDS